MQSLRAGEDPTQAKVPGDREELLAMKYSPEIIEQAKNYRTRELAYLSELIQEEPDVPTDPMRVRHLKGEKVERKGKKGKKGEVSVEQHQEADTTPAKPNSY